MLKTVIPLITQPEAKEILVIIQGILVLDINKDFIYEEYKSSRLTDNNLPSIVIYPILKREKSFKFLRTY